MEEYNSNEEDFSMVIKAYEYAEKLHEGQKRQSGEPYITHPLAVAMILSELEADIDTIAAALLHDVIEDCNVPKEYIAAEFNPFIADLVDGVTKISDLQFESKDEEFATNTRKLISTISEEIRIIIIKLADRLHNMRTLEYVDERRRLTNSNETRDIFAPIADRLGLRRIKEELDDLSFKYLDPATYIELSDQVNKIKVGYSESLSSMIDNTKSWLYENQIPNEMRIRNKNLYGIQKRLDDKENLYNMPDLMALIVKVNNIKTCYETLGLVHEKYKPTNIEMRDYLFHPKVNMYRSIHTNVFGPENRVVQYRIRTHEIDREASYGIVANWQAHKSDINEVFRKNIQLYDSIVDLSLESNDQHFLEAIYKELDTYIYAFTPTGNIVQLPIGSTAIDFAYKLGDEYGDKLNGVIINGEEADPLTELSQKAIVNILTDDCAAPKEEWIDHCVTRLAKRKILTYTQNNVTL